MKILRNEYLIKADPEATSKKIINGVELFIDTSWDKIAHAVRFGEIFEAPLSFDEDYKGGPELKKGNKVFFHQFVVQPGNIINVDGQDYYRAHYKQVWCKIEDDKIIPVDQWLFVLPIKEKEEELVTPSGIIAKLTPSFVNQKGYVHAMSDYCKTLGLKEGDLIHFMTDADYPLEINGTTYFRMRADSVICVENDGALEPLANKLIVLENEQKQEEGLILLPPKESQQKYGKVLRVGEWIEDLYEKDEICFVYGIGTDTTLNNIAYRVLRKDHVLWKIDKYTKSNKLGIQLFA